MALCAKEVMTTDVIVSREDMSVKDFVALLRTNGISGTPVLDGEDHLVGVASATDVLLHSRVFEGEWQMDSDYHTQVGEDSELIAEAFEDDDVQYLTVGDIMSPDTITAQAHTPVRDLAALLCNENIRRIIILEDKRLVGIVSMTDLLRAIAYERIK